MKGLAGVLGILLAFLFAFLLCVPLTSWGSSLAGVSGLATPVVDFAHALPTIWMILVGAIGVGLVIGAVAAISKL